MNLLEELSEILPNFSTHSKESICGLLDSYYSDIKEIKEDREKGHLKKRRELMVIVNRYFTYIFPRHANINVCNFLEDCYPRYKMIMDRWCDINRITNHIDDAFCKAKRADRFLITVSYIENGKTHHLQGYANFPLKELTTSLKEQMELTPKITQA